MSGGTQQVISALMLSGKRLDRPINLEDVVKATSAWEQIGMKANAALVRSMWDEVARGRAAQRELAAVKRSWWYRIINYWK